MAIGHEVETFEPEIENPDISYIQDLSVRLLKEVDFFLQDQPSTLLDVGGLKAKLERYSGGGFDLDSVDFNCLRRVLNFLVIRRGREDLQADLKRVLEIQQKYQNG